METTREVNPAWLAWGTYDHAKNDYVCEGDIPASYSGDCIAMGQQVRKPDDPCVLTPTGTNRAGKYNSSVNNPASLLGC